MYVADMKILVVEDEPKLAGLARWIWGLRRKMGRLPILPWGYAAVLARVAASGGSILAKGK